MNANSISPTLKRSLCFMRRTRAILIGTLLLATLAACNTVQGVGRDIESVGRAGKEVIH
jgi:predicted small secreted protein